MRRQLLVHPPHRKCVPPQLPPWCSFYHNGWVVVAVHGHQQCFLAPFPCLKKRVKQQEQQMSLIGSDHFINNQPDENINTCPYIFYISQFMP
jgi:hypothetical protein